MRSTWCLPSARPPDRARGQNRCSRNCRRAFAARPCPFAASPSKTDRPAPSGTPGGAIRSGVRNNFMPTKLKLRRIVLVALRNHHRHIHALARLFRIEKRNFDSLAIHVVDLFGVIDDARGEVALRLIELPDAFGILVQLRGIVSAGEQILENQRVRECRSASGSSSRESHRAAKCLVALNNNVAHFHFRAFIDCKCDIHATRRHLAESAA